MLHQIRVTRPVFSDRERATAIAIAEAAIPRGRFMPGAGPATVDRLEGYLAAAGETVAAGYRAMLRAVDAAAVARHLRPFAALSLARRIRFLESWRTGGYLRRSGLRLLLMPLKALHYDDPAFFRQVGCVYGFETPQADDRPRWLRERVTSVSDLSDGEEIECDVVVVGTGAGGAVVGKELAERGLAVVLLEEGGYFTRRDFNGHAREMQLKLYRNMMQTISVGNTGIPIPVGRSVGGSTTVNSGTCYRVPDRVLFKWRNELGLTEFTPELLAEYYERVEAILGVAEADPRHLGDVAHAIARGCERLGYAHRPLRRNAPDCDGKGVCCFGCPTDAKRSTNVSYVPLALRAGAQLITGARVERVLLQRGRAAGVRAHGRGGKTITVRARATVVSCGTFYTPVLLDESGVGKASGQLGRNLSIHPCAAALAWFAEPMQGWNGIPQSYAIEAFHDEGILFEGGTPPLDFGASTLTLLGPRFVELVEQFDRACVFGFLIEDTSRGRVFNRGGKPIITYVMNDRDVRLVQRAIEILARVFFAAGARRVVPMVHGFDELEGEADLARLRNARLSARDFDLTAYHPLGTARMGVDPRSSVVGRDHLVHDCPDLYVVDGSSVPSSLAVNPQLTIMAMATRAAELLAARL